MPAPRPDDRAALNLAAPSGSTAWPRVDLPFALPGAAARLPECANRHRKKVVGKGDDGWSRWKKRLTVTPALVGVEMGARSVYDGLFGSLSASHARTPGAIERGSLRHRSRSGNGITVTLSATG